MTQVHPLTFNSIPSLAELEAAFPSVKVLLFDMDGTLFDTEKHHAWALQTIGKQYQIIPPLGPHELYELMVGKADHLLFEIIKDWPNFPQHWSARDLIDEKNQHLLKIFEKTDPQTYLAPELQELLNQMTKKGLRLGLVTSSEKVITMELMKLSGMGSVFDFILTGDDCPQVKPDPWPYLHAMKHFQVTKEEVLIFEDSSVGLEAARASGAHVIKVEWY